jgi:hypothetical protein
MSTEAARSRFVPALVLAGLGVAFVFLAFMFVATDGHFVPQVTDLYLVCQYAKAMAEGHPFHYYPDEPASTGATSLLHTALLAAAHAAGFRGEGLIAFTIVLGVVCYLASIALAARIGQLLGGARVLFLAGALLTLGGPTVWGYMYGSDTAIAMALALWLFERLLTTWDRGPVPSAAAPAALLALTRPEGLSLALGLGGAWTLLGGARRSARGMAIAWAPVAAGLLVLLLNRITTGLWLGTSVADKSLFANFALSDALALVAGYGVDVARGLLLGLYPPEAPVGFSRGWSAYFFPPGALLLIALAIARPRERHQVPVRIWAALVAAVFALVAPSVFMGVHFNRYLMWAFPTLLALTAAGWGEASRIASRGDQVVDTQVFRAGAMIALGLGLLATLRFAGLYGEMAGQVYTRDVAAASWIERSLPHGARIANIATSVEYLTGHRNINLHGVTSSAFFGMRTAEREASVLEALVRLPERERPEYLLSTVSTQEALATMREMAGPVLFRTSSLADEIVIAAFRPDILEGGTRLVGTQAVRAVEGLREVDRLNVCDALAEREHRYGHNSHLGSTPLHGSARIDAYPGSEGAARIVADGGRAILGAEWFEIRADRGRDLVAVMRTAPWVAANTMRAAGAGQIRIDIPEATIGVETEGRMAARLKFQPSAGWHEQVFRIPGAFLGEGRTRLRLSGRFASFHYWFYQ